MTNESSPKDAGGRPGRLGPMVRLLGAVSLLNDVASEMITPILPIFLTSRLGAGPAAIGLIEGVAEAASSVLKGVSGRAADRTRHSRKLVIGGYALSNIVRPLVALAGSWPVVLALRFVDRVGKGVRTAPRDALIGRSTPPSMRGRAFGFHRAMDHLGATIGPLIAFGLLTAGADLGSVFLLSAIPGAALVLLLIVRLAAVDRASQGTGDGTVGGMIPVAPMGGGGSTTHASGTAVGKLASALLIQAFMAVPDAFLVLWAVDRGLSTAAIPLVWAAAHAARSGVVRWVGGYSDRSRRTSVVAGGWTARAVVLLVLATAVPSMVVTILLFVAWAAVAASTEGAERALVADWSAARTQGTAFGTYHMAIGLTALPGAVLFGFLWESLGSGTAFLVAAAGTAVAAAVMATVRGVGSPGVGTRVSG